MYSIPREAFAVVSRRRIAAMLAGGALLATGACADTSPAGYRADAEEEAVQVAAIALISRHEKPHDTLWVETRTVEYDSTSLAWLQRKYADDAPASALAAFAAANRTRRLVRLPRTIAGRVVIVADSGWRMPPAALRYITSVSGVGVSAARDTALVEVTTSCAPICGSTQLMVLVREAGVWHARGALRAARF